MCTPQTPQQIVGSPTYRRPCWRLQPQLQPLLRRRPITHLARRSSSSGGSSSSSAGSSSSRRQHQQAPAPPAAAAPGHAAADTADSSSSSSPSTSSSDATPPLEAANGHANGANGAAAAANGTPLEAAAVPRGIAAALASHSEATDTEQILQPLLPPPAALAPAGVAAAVPAAGAPAAVAAAAASPPAAAAAASAAAAGAGEAAAAGARKQEQASSSNGAPGASGAGADVPRSIVVLSCVSMALTSASCVFNTLLPIYMVAELKLTMRSLGAFEGCLEAFSYAVRMFSGVLSDRMASRKAAIAAGFAMGAAAKFGLSSATTVGQLFIGKAVDRLGNGVQAAPRDALIGDLSPPGSRSACFGFAQSMRKVGSFVGAGLVFALMKATGNNYQAIFLGAAGVSALATAAFLAFVPSHPNAGGESKRAAAAAAAAEAAAAAQQQQQLLEQQQRIQQQQQQQGAGQQQQQTQQQQQQQLQQAAGEGAGASTSSTSTSSGDGLAASARALWRDVRAMGGAFYRTLAVIGLYGLGHINESMLEARAIEVGFGKAEATLVVALLCLSVSLCAYPLGRLDDRRGPRTTFALGMAALLAGDLVLLLSGAWPPAVFVACVLWGVHWAVVQGPMLGVVVAHAPPHLRGTAFGIFYSLMAVTAVVANTIYGAVWHARGAEAAFGLSAAVILAALLLALPRLPAQGGAGAGAGAAAAAAAARGGEEGGNGGGAAAAAAAA